MAKQKTKVVKRKVVKAPKAKKDKSKGADEPWEVWSVNVNSGYHTWDTSLETHKQAVDFIKDNANFRAPVIVHTIIEPMEY